MEQKRELKANYLNIKVSDKIKKRLHLSYINRQRNSQESWNQAHQAYIESKDNKLDNLELESLYHLCLASMYFEEVQNPMNYIEKLKKRGIELKKRVYIGRSYIFSYRLEKRAGDLLTASKHLIKSLEYFDETENKPELASCYTGLGNIHFKFAEYSKALEYYQSSLTFLQGSQIDYRNLILQNIAACHFQLEHFDDSWQIYFNLLETIPDNSFELKRLIFQNLGEICTKTQEWDSAIEYYEQAIFLCEKLNLKSPLVHSLCNLGDIYLELEKFDLTLEAFLQAEEIADKNELVSDKIDVYKFLINYYREQENLTKLVMYQDKLIDVLNNLLKKESKAYLEEFETR